MWIKIRGTSEKPLPQQDLPSVDIEPGAQVILHYDKAYAPATGGYGVIRRLNGTTATFVEMTQKGGMIIQSHLETKQRIIRPEHHILAVREEKGENIH